jgi:gliding motility-associated-like protein
MNPRILFTAALLPGLFSLITLAQPCLNNNSFSISASPPPVGGTYACGQTVTFCFTITNWNTTNANWFHGITATFGPGWNMASLVPGTPPPTCGTGGTWGWYTSVQGTAGTNQGPTGPGFFFDLNNDGNPGNNFGDFCTPSYWQFCWTISVNTGAACVNGASLNVIFNTLSDSQTGSWGSSACVNDPNPVYTANVQACPISAGTNGTLTVCSSSPGTNLFASLGGTPTSGGAWTAPGGGAHSGVLDPAIAVSGNYTYTVTSTSPPCTASAVVAVTVVPQPSAGSNGSTTVCTGDAAFPLSGLLGGSPTAGGTWEAPDGMAFSGTFDPAIHMQGVYTYTIAAAAPCTQASATVTVTVNPTPNAGSNGSLAICSNGAPTALFPLLGGTPSTGGTWTGPGGTAFSGTYDPAIHASGTYTYTITPLAPCPISTATITVTEQPQPQAGTSAQATLCASSPSTALLGLLGGSPAPGGTWTGPGGVAVGPSIDPATAASGAYVYTVAGTAPCASAQATLTLTILAQPSAGTAGTLNLCSSAPAVDLFTALGGSPTSGGSWTGPTGGASSSTFTPGTSAPGVYTYTTPSLPPCPTSTATVTVNVTAQPNAGTNASTTVCSSGSAIALFPLLGNAAQAGGTWTAPGGGAFSGSFVPGTSAAGAYTYTVSAPPPCTAASSTVTVTVVNAVTAGTGGSITLCANDPPVDPMSWLTGSPTPGGSWSGPSGAVSGPVVPSTAASGTYTYTVQGVAPCPTQQSSVTLTISPLPYAGVDAPFSICAEAAPASLFPVLGPGVNNGGQWSGPGGAATGSFDPSGMPAGAYTYTVTGTGGCIGEVDQATITVAVNPSPVPDFSFTPASGCAPMLVQFSNATPGSASASWNFGDGSTGVGVLNSSHAYGGGLFSVTLTVTDMNGCTGSTTLQDTIFASLGPSAQFTATPMEVSVDDPTIELAHTDRANVTYDWTIDGSPLNGTGAFSHTITPAILGPHIVCLTATDDLGCANTECLQVVVMDELTIYVPNAFTPNNDGINDVFLPSVLGHQPDKYELVIFDRWGREVFSTTDPLQGWNGGLNNGGDPLPDGVYTWKLNARDRFSLERRQTFGMVSLLK